MGHVQEAERDVAVVGDVQGCASLRVNMWELPNAFSDLLSWQVAPNLHVDHTLQVHDRFSEAVDVGGADVVLGAVVWIFTHYVKKIMK